MSQKKTTIVIDHEDNVVSLQIDGGKEFRFALVSLSMDKGVDEQTSEDGRRTFKDDGSVSITITGQYPKD